MGTFDTDFTAVGPSNLGFLASGSFKGGGLFYGGSIGVQGSATPTSRQSATLFGLIGTTDPAGPDWVSTTEAGAWGTSQSGPGVVGTSSFDAGVAGQHGDVFVISEAAGVVGSSQDSPGVSGVSMRANGVVGRSDTGFGVVGHSNKSTAVVGISGEGFGIVGGPANGVLGISNLPGPEFTDAPAGVVGTSALDQGVRGTSFNNAGIYGQTGGWTRSRISSLAFTARRKRSRASSVFPRRATAPGACHSRGPRFEQSPSSAPA